MKHSKLRVQLKNLLFFFLILLLSFGGGFYFGAFPETAFTNLGFKDQKIRWICVEEACPSQTLLEKLEENTETQFQLIAAVNSIDDLKSSSLQADIILATRPMLNAIKGELSIIDGKSYAGKLHPDFEIFAIKDKVGIPLFWKLNPSQSKKLKNVVRIYSLGFFQESRLTETQKNFLIENFIDPNIQNSWIKENSLATALNGFENISDLKEEQKPSSLRNLSLKDIVIEN